MRSRRRVTCRLTAAVLAFGGVVAGVAGGVPGSTTAAYAAEKGIPCSAYSTPDAATQVDPVPMPADPFPEMGIPEAQQTLQQEGKGLGKGVTVAVVDSGVEGVHERPPFPHSQPYARDYHGTTVAGLIQRVAPGVRLLDLPVYVPPSPDGATPGKVSAQSLSDALNVLLQRRDLNHLIVNMSLDIAPWPGLGQQIKALQDRGAIVVAATGNVDSDGTGTASPPPPGADYAKKKAPALYPGVVAVGASFSKDADGDDISQFDLPNSRTTVVAPTYGARSVTLNGAPCFVDQTATSWSTAEVSGVLALIASAYPKDSNTALVDRLVRTASGRPDEPGRFTGAGVVQAYDAVTRPLAAHAPSRSGTVKQATVAPPAADVLASTRHNTIWWGLIGGGALLLGLVLRPLVTRRK